MAWYAQFEGVEGSCAHKDHKGWVSLSGCTFSFHKAGGGATGSARVGGKVHIDDVTVGVVADKALPKLIEAGVKGKVFPKVTIDGTATFGDAGEQSYLKVELENVQLTSGQLGVLDNDASTDDLHVTLNFEKYKLCSTEYGKDGSKKGNAECEWQIEEGE